MEVEKLMQEDCEKLELITREACIEIIDIVTPERYEKHPDSFIALSLQCSVMLLALSVRRIVLYTNAEERDIIDHFIYMLEDCLSKAEENDNKSTQ